MQAHPINLDANLTLNEIVAQLPEALTVFQRFGLDTCCGGALPLASAAAHHGLDVAAVLAALQKATTRPEAPE